MHAPKRRIDLVPDTVQIICMECPKSIFVPISGHGGTRQTHGNRLHILHIDGFWRPVDRGKFARVVQRQKAVDKRISLVESFTQQYDRYAERDTDHRAVQT